MTDPCFSLPSRRTVLASIAGALGAVACDDRSAGALTNTSPQTPVAPALRVSTRPARSLSRFGVDRFATRDQWSLLKAAFEAAHVEGFDLFADPDANYRHDGALLLDGVVLDGRGCTFTALSDGPQVLRCVGDNWRVANIRLLGTARSRSADDNANGIMIGDGEHPATNFVLENVTVDTVGPGRGVGAAGFMFNNASRGRIVRPTVRHSLSDGIHITNGSHDLMFDRPVSENTGDDGFAVVTYRRQQRLCHSIHVDDGISRDSAARGYSVVGGRDIVYQRCLVERSAAAGAYFYSEDAYDTYGVQRCRLIDPVLRDCVTGRGLPTGFSNAALIIGGRAGADMIDGASLPRGAVDCTVINPVVQGAGSACWAGISTHEYAIRPRIIGGRLIGLVPPAGPVRTNGVEIGGRDVIVDGLHTSDVAGGAIVITKSASGTCVVNRPVVTGSRLHSASNRCYVYADPAPGLRRISVQGGRFSRGPDKFVIDLLPPGRMRLVNNRVL